MRQGQLFESVGVSESDSAQIKNTAPGDNRPAPEPSRRAALNASFAALESRILHGLSCEWEAALDLLDPSVARILCKPSFRLVDSGRQLGQWRSDRRQIAISRHLALNHGWDDVRDVLRHEMAHQLADAMLKNHQESPHGPTFQNACAWLRADPRASGSFPPLADRIRSAAADAPDRILVRVKKLLALAASANRHEAEAAMAKAHELIDRHNIDLIRDHQPRDYVSVFLGQPALRQRREAYFLAAVLADFYYVEAIWVPAFVLAKERMGRVLEVSGTPRNVIMAEYVHDFVNHHIHASWRAWSGRPNGARRYSDYAVGVISGFREKLARSIQPAQNAAAADRAVIRRDDPQLAAYCRHRYPRIRSSRSGGGPYDPRILAAGEQVGRDMVIHQGVTETAGTPGGLLPSE